jgi:hypothetical protein
MGYLQCKTIGALICVGVALATAAASAPGVEIELSGKFGEFRLVNRGAAIQLNSAVNVQQQVNGKWEDLPVTNLYLIPSCTRSPVPECVLLAAKSSLQPVPWSGNYCSSQCMANCNLDGPVSPGVYRYVVTSCDHERQIFSVAFEKKAGESKGSPAPRK